MEVLITFITLLAAFYGILTYWHKYVREPEDTKLYIAQLFESAKERNKQLLGELNKYASANNAYNEHFMQGFTFSDTIQLIERTERELLTEENLQAIRKSSGTGRNIESLINHLKTHDKHVSECLTHFHYFFFKHNTENGNVGD